MEFVEYVKGEFLVLVPVLYFIGMGARKMGLGPKLLPPVIGATGIALALLYIVATCEHCTYRGWLMAAFAAITQGILVAGASVFATAKTK